MISPRIYGIFPLQMTKELNMANWQPGQCIILYQSPQRSKHRLTRSIGLIFLILPFLFFLVFYAPIIKLELAYRFRKTEKIAGEKSLAFRPSLSGFGQLLFLNERGIISPANSDFALIIAKIGLNVPVVYNVDPADEKQYREALKNGVAHAKNTSLPNESGVTYLFGHSSNFPWEISPFNQVFYLLPKLEKNDEIILVFKGQNFVYRVSEKRVAEANDVSYLVSATGENKLVLQTCWPPGTDWKRYIVIAKPVVSSTATKESNNIL